MRAEVGHANTERIVLRGHDVVEELVGQVSFTQATLLAITGKMPSPSAVRVADAVMVTFIDHGMQPSALAARLTYAVAPEAIQGAVAAGLPWRTEGGRGAWLRAAARGRPVPGG